MRVNGEKTSESPGLAHAGAEMSRGSGLSVEMTKSGLIFATVSDASSASVWRELSIDGKSAGEDREYREEMVSARRIAKEGKANGVDWTGRRQRGS